MQTFLAIDGLAILRSNVLQIREALTVGARLCLQDSTHGLPIPRRPRILVVLQSHVKLLQRLNVFDTLGKFKDLFNRPVPIEEVLNAIALDKKHFIGILMSCDSNHQVNGLLKLFGHLAALCVLIQQLTQLCFINPFEITTQSLSSSARPLDSGDLVGNLHGGIIPSIVLCKGFYPSVAVWRRHSPARFS